eukprot:g23473.t1
MTVLAQNGKYDPTFVKAYSRKGAAHFFMKEYHKSLQAYEQGLKLDPENQETPGFWPALPIAPYERRLTKRYEVLPGELWTFEQKQGILYIHVPIRMTVYRSSAKRREGAWRGHLWRMTTRRGLLVYAPVAPTDECLSLLRELEEQHGEVLHIVLPTVAVEHKSPGAKANHRRDFLGGGGLVQKYVDRLPNLVWNWYFVGPFSQKFPQAQVWVCPGQFSVPLQLPLQLLGFPSNVKTLSHDSLPKEWQDEGLDFRVLGPVGKDLQNGPFAEVEPRALAFHARDDATSPLETSPEALLRGWRRMALFALFFQSSAIDPEPVSKALSDAFNSEAKDLGWGGLLPWRFRKDWKKSFDALRGGGGGLFVAPILSELILNRDFVVHLSWSMYQGFQRYLSSDVWPFVEETASRWADMERIIPAHFDAPVSATAEEPTNETRERSWFLGALLAPTVLGSTCSANLCARCCGNVSSYNCSLPGLQLFAPGQYQGLQANYLSFATLTSSPNFLSRAEEFEACTGGSIVFAEAQNIWEDPIKDMGTKEQRGNDIYHAYFMSYSHFPEASALGLAESLEDRLAASNAELKWETTFPKVQQMGKYRRSLDAVNVDVHRALRWGARMTNLS